MRYVPTAKLHPIIGEHAEVRDTREKRAVTIYTGLEAWEKAVRRCKELNDANDGPKTN